MFFSASSKNKTFTLLDNGTSKITCCIVHSREGTEPHIVGFSCVASQGISNGAIIQLDKATECISLALKEAEKNAYNPISIPDSFMSFKVRIKSGCNKGSPPPLTITPRLPRFFSPFTII